MLTTLNKYYVENVELLDHARILANIATDMQNYPLIILDSVDSTNQYALNQSAPSLICLAEYQTQGRGRQGRQWVSPYASGLCLSIKQRYTELCYPLSGLNIALAVIVAHTLQQLGIPEVKIKWPNDIQWHGHKLAGLLLESRYTADRCWDVVIGIGINVRMPIQCTEAIGQQWVDLYSIMGQPISRNILAARLIDNCWQTLLTYPQVGLASFATAWRMFDVLYKRQVILHTPKGQIVGIAKGINEQGALILQQGDQTSYHNYGEVSVRL